MGKYIGSTKNIKVREQLHKSNAKCNVNREPYLTINSTGGFKNWKMEVLEQFESEDKAYVYEREQYWLDQTANKLNKRNAKFNLNAYMKKWYDNHKESILDKKKIYYENNREKRIAYQRAYVQKKKSASNINDSQTNEVACQNQEV
jgi:hypothetical protein